MNEKIHKILQDAGVAKGLTQEEVFQMMLLGNDVFLGTAKEKLAEATKKGEITQGELAGFLHTLDECSREYRELNKSVYENIRVKGEELMNEYAQKMIQEEEQKQKELMKANQILTTFLSQHSHA